MKGRIGEDWRTILTEAEKEIPGAISSLSRWAYTGILDPITARILNKEGPKFSSQEMKILKMDMEAVFESRVKLGNGEVEIGEEGLKADPRLVNIRLGESGLMTLQEKLSRPGLALEIVLRWIYTGVTVNWNRDYALEIYEALLELNESKELGIITHCLKIIDEN